MLQQITKFCRRYQKQLCWVFKEHRVVSTFYKTFWESRSRTRVALDLAACRSLRPPNILVQIVNYTNRYAIGQTGGRTDIVTVARATRFV